MTKLFIFPNPNKNYDRISTFVKNLINSANNQRVRNERFKQLILAVECNLASSLQTKNDSRRSYLSANDLHQDLVECACDDHMHIKNGSVSPSIGFEIKT